MTINPFSTIHFTSYTIKIKEQLYTYFVFTGFENLDASQGLFEELASLENNLTYKFNIEKIHTYESNNLINEHLKKLEANLISNNDENVQDEGLQAVYNFIRNFVDTESHELIQEEITETQKIKTDIARNKNGLLKISLIVRIEIKDKKEARKIIELIERKTSNLKINLPAGFHIQDKLHKAYTNQKNIDADKVLIVDHTESDKFFPFYYSTTEINNKSVFLGSHTSGNTPAFINFDFSNDIANHALLLGSTGMGKSALVKSLLWQFRHLGYRLIILDPQNEYIPITKALEGQDVDLSENRGLNLFDLGRFESVLDINHLILFLFESIIGSQLSQIQQQSINSLLHSAKKAGKDYFQEFLRLIQKDENLKIFYPALSNEKTVKLLTDSSNSSIYDNDVLRFSFNNLNASQMTLFVGITSQIIGQLMSDRNRPTVVILDEAFKFLNQKSSSDQVISWLQQMRKLNTSVFLIDQSIRDYNETANTIWENTTHHFLFRHNKTNQINLDFETYERIKSLKPYSCYYHSQNQQFYSNIIIPDNIFDYVRSK